MTKARENINSMTAHRSDKWRAKIQRRQKRADSRINEDITKL